MDFELGEEEKAFEAELERFLEAERSPEVMDHHPEQLSQTVDTPAKRAFMRKLAERGWLGMSWPEAYGGKELSGIHDFILTEALSRQGAPQPGKGVGIVGKTIIRHGSEALKRKFLPRIVRGEVEFAIGYSEPGAGSDAANMQLRATKVDGGWSLTGQKVWTTSAHFADWYWVGARTNPEARKHEGITLFLIPMDHPGLTIRPTWTIGDERTNEVFFDQVFVPDDHVVGEVGRGWTYICEALDLERFAMMPVGPLEKKVEALVDHVRCPERDGRPLRQDPEARRRVARLVTELEVSRMLQRRVIAEALKGGVPTVQSSQYKLFMNETGQRVADAALDLLGPEAQLKPGEEGALVDGRFERSYRYTVVDTIGGGASEIQKNIIARRGLGLPPNF
ncbi:MAG: acyl-CoA dehydrogenase family protein [Myxococcota bacterium]|nr:acyl-CoA dehydrogenase family protein [Myxococcota bacterium]